MFRGASLWYESLRCEREGAGTCCLWTAFYLFLEVFSCSFYVFLESPIREMAKNQASLDNNKKHFTSNPTSKKDSFFIYGILVSVTMAVTAFFVLINVSAWAEARG